MLSFFVSDIAFCTAVYNFCIGAMISVLINSEPNKGSSISTDYYHLGDLSLSLSGRDHKCLSFDETDIASPLVQ